MAVLESIALEGGEHRAFGKEKIEVLKNRGTFSVTRDLSGP